MPVLKRNYASTAESCCLRNTGSRSSMTNSFAEYQLITSDSMLRKLTQVKIPHKGSGDYLPLLSYLWYQWDPSAFNIFKQNFSSPLGREEFNKWLYGLFFKLALPSYRDYSDRSAVILTPLNVTTFFRMLIHLHTRGYPSH